MKNTHLALAAFAISIICAAGAAYSAIINGIYYPNGATLGCVTAALTGGYLWYHNDQPEQEETTNERPRRTCLILGNYIRRPNLHPRNNHTRTK